MKKVENIRSSGSSARNSLDSFSGEEIMQMTPEEFALHCPGGKRNSLPKAGELALGKAGTEEDDDEGRSKKGGEAILAGHTAERFRRSGSSFGEFKANQLEKIAQTATQSEDVRVACGEVIRSVDTFPCGLKNTLEDPTVVAADASEQRSRLAAEADVLEMAVDAAETIGAQNSLEKMQAHQLAAAHRMAMHFARLALKEKDVERACRLTKASMAAMRSYQQGQDSLHRGRRGGRQVVTVQRVNINEGGKAVIAGQLNEPAA